MVIRYAPVGVVSQDIEEEVLSMLEEQHTVAATQNEEAEAMAEILEEDDQFECDEGPEPDLIEMATLGPDDGLPGYSRYDFEQDCRLLDGEDPFEPDEDIEGGVYATQGGGRATWDPLNSRYVFTEKPGCPGLEVGDFVPELWGVILIG